MRDAAIAIIREIGVETGGSNIQFAINPDNGAHDRHRDEPARVSRSSALASKATGFPIAKIAAKLAVGYRLDELRNDITRETPACFEPTIDYVVTKVPRWTFEKFPDADPTLTTQMKSVGETMAIGRTFKESLQKALRGLETGRFGLGCDRDDRWGTPKQPTIGRDRRPAGDAERRADLVHPLRLQGRHDGRGHPPADEDRPLVPAQHPARSSRWRTALRGAAPDLEAAPAPTLLLEAKQDGFSDRQLAHLWHTTESEVRRAAQGTGRRAGRSSCVDTCAAEFEAYTPYYYSTYEAPIRRSRGSRMRMPIRTAHAIRFGTDVRGRDRAPRRQGPHHDPRRRPQPHRPGHRVRLLLLPGRVRPARGRLRDHHGQLEPGDGLDRLRHQRPPVLRAADRRGRAEHLRPR